ncbi:TadE family protein [Aurantimonas sp. A2-1-M11]|uniref:TadE/TadG family type IV pilus assembly protein n=1 Tax=Aurantimonas sp. A2-1-M11 TaxID=3113712 RepID=UPI002F952898
MKNFPAPAPRTIKSFTCDTSGTSAVEFAIVASLFLMIFFGIIGFGWAFWMKNDLARAADKAARYAYIHGEKLDEIKYVFLSSTTAESGNIVLDVTAHTINSRRIIKLNAETTLPITIPFASVLEDMLLKETRTIELKP